MMGGSRVDGGFHLNPPVGVSPAPGRGVSYVPGKGTPRTMSPLGGPLAAPGGAWPSVWPAGAGVTPRVGTGPHRRDSFLDCVLVFLRAAPQSGCSGPRCGGPARSPGTTPPCLRPREIPGALRHPPGVLAGPLAGVAVSHSVSLQQELSLLGWRDPKGHESPVAPVTLGRVPAA